MSAIGKVQVDFIANIGQFARGVKDATKTTATFASSVGRLAGKGFSALHGTVTKVTSAVTSLKTVMAGAIVTFGAFRFASGLNAAADTVDRLGKASKRLGITVEQLSALRFAAGESGIEFEALATMASKAAKGVAQIVADGNTAAKVGRLTVRLTDAAGQVRNIADLLPDLAKGIESAGSEAEQLRLAQKFFGKAGGDDFVTLLKESGTFVKGLAEQTERARRLGVIFTEDQVEKLTAYRDAVGRVQEAWLGVKVKLMTEIAPVLTRLLDDLAIRTANIPRAVGAIRNAIGVAAGGGKEAVQAGELLQTLGRQVTNLLIVAAREAGNIFATTVVEGFRQVGTNIAIELADSLRKYLPDWLLNDTWFSPGDPTVGSEKKLKDLIRTREELVRLNDEVARLQEELNNNPYLDGQDRVASQTQLNSALAALKRLSSTDFVVLDKQIKAAQNELAMNAGQLAQQRAQLTVESARRIKEAFVGGESEIAKALAEADAAMAALTAKYATKEFVGPPAPPKQKAPDLFKAFDASVEAAKDTGRRIGAGLAKGWELFKDAAKKAWEHTQDVLKDAQEIRFSIYPQEKMEAEIEHVRAVRRELLRLGEDSKLTEEDVQKAIAKIRESYKETPKEVKNLATDMRDAIKDFAGDAGQAFADFAFEAKASLGDLLKSWGKTLFAMAVQAMIFKPLFDGLGGAFGKWFGTTAAGQTPTGTPGTAAAGGPVSGGSWSWVGERGPELVQFGRSGYVYPNGVMPSGGGTLVQVIDQRGSGARPEVSENRGPDGRQMIKILIRDEVRGMVSDGSLDRTMASSYGVTRRGTSR